MSGGMEEASQNEEAVTRVEKAVEELCKALSYNAWPVADFHPQLLDVANDELAALKSPLRIVKK